MKEDVINIAIAADVLYLVHARVMLCSLFENNKFTQFKIFLFTDVQNGIELDKIQQLVEKNASQMEVVVIDKSLFEGFYTSGHITIAAYYRLIIPNSLPSGIQKIIYLDTDIIIKDDIRELWNVELEDACLAAVDDNTPSHVDRLGLPVGSTYFNSGVLLIDVQQWRKRDITHKGLELARIHGDKLVTYDQDVLNMLLVNEWKELPSKWNQMEGHRLGYLEQTPTIVHFVGPKPWSIHCIHPLKGEYYRYYYKMEGFPRRLADVTKRWTQAVLRAISK